MSPELQVEIIDPNGVCESPVVEILENDPHHKVITALQQKGQITVWQILGIRDSLVKAGVTVKKIVSFTK